MTVSEWAQIPSVLIVIAMLVTCAEWIINNRKAWRLIMPIVFWLTDWAMFLAAIYLYNEYQIRIGLNIWGQVLMMHAGLTFITYMFAMRYRHPSEGGR